MLRFLNTILFFFLLTTFAKAEIVKDIQIIGNKKVSKETIKIYGDIKINENYNEKKLNDILNNLYKTNFFENVDVKLSNNILTVSLSEFPTINQIIILGEKSKRRSDQIKKIISLKDKQSFIRSKLSSDIELIKNYYSSAGFNSAEIQAKVKNFEDSIDLIFDITIGNETKISTINFTGNKKISDKRLRDIIASEEHKFWKFISSNTKFSERLVLLDERLLKNYYKSIGYYDVVINSKSAVINENNDIDITYTIDSGTRYIIKKITTNVDSVFDKKIFEPLRKEYNEYIGSYYSPFSIKKLLVEIDSLIEDRNIQFVEHNVETIVENDGIEIKFNIFESEKIIVERVDITGNNITNESVIRSELLLDEGDPFSELALSRSVSNLKSLGIFSEVESNVTVSEIQNQKNITINVEEKPTGEVSAGAGVGSTGGSFAFTVSENNWLGTGNRVDFQLDVDAESIGGRFSFTDNNHNFTGNQLNYYISSTSNDKPNQGYENTIISSGINTYFEQYKDVYLSLGLSASFDDLRTVNSASTKLKNQAGEFSEIAASYGLTTDKRDRSFMPTSGYISSFNQKLPIFADKQAIGNTFSLSKYKLLSEDVVTASKIFLSSINGLNDEDVRLNERKFLSTRRLRGFERGKVGPVDGDDHIGGNYAAALNFEASFPNLLPDSSKAEFATFLDIGNVWGVDYDKNLDETNTLRSSAGVSLGWNSPVGPMSFILSTNLKKADTDETESFTFNLGTTF
jgi:outer membrane protein insertion porin family